MTLFLADESPNFIELQLTAGEITHLAIEKPRATLSYAHPKAHDRIAVNACHSFDCPNTRAFRQCAHDCHLLVDA